MQGERVPAPGVEHAAHRALGPGVVGGERLVARVHHIADFLFFGLVLQRQRGLDLPTQAGPLGDQHTRTRFLPLDVLLLAQRPDAVFVTAGIARPGQLDPAGLPVGLHPRIEFQPQAAVEDVAVQPRRLHPRAGVGAVAGPHAELLFGPFHHLHLDRHRRGQRRIGIDAHGSLREVAAGLEHRLVVQQILLAHRLAGFHRTEMADDRRRVALVAADLQFAVMECRPAVHRQRQIRRLRNGIDARLARRDPRRRVARRQQRTDQRKLGRVPVGLAKRHARLQGESALDARAQRRLSRIGERALDADLQRADPGARARRHHIAHQPVVPRPHQAAVDARREVAFGREQFACGHLAQIAQPAELRLVQHLALPRGARRLQMLRQQRLELVGRLHLHRQRVRRRRAQRGKQQQGLDKAVRQGRSGGRVVSPF